MKLTEPMLRQIAEYAITHERSGVYWGNKEQFLKRHNKIMDWIDSEFERLGHPLAAEDSAEDIGEAA